MRREDEVVPAPHALLAHPVFHGLADEAALGVPEDEPRARDLLNAEEVELTTQDAVVARLDLLQPLEVRVEVLRVEERRPVDALQLLVLLVAQPVGARDGGDPEGLDAARGGKMRAAAEVGEAAVLVERDRVAGLGELLDEVDLHEVALRGVLGQPLVARFLHAHERLVARDDLRHARLDCGQVGFGERSLAVDVVEEAVVGGGPMAELGLGKQLQNRGRHHMRGGVAQHLQRGLVGLLQQP